MFMSYLVQPSALQLASILHQESGIKILRFQIKMLPDFSFVSLSKGHKNMNKISVVSEVFLGHLVMTTSSPADNSEPEIPSVS